MSAPPMLHLSTIRGLVLGLLLGDAVGTAGGRPSADGLLPAGGGGQLACWTMEGLIRALVRFDHKGICHPPGVVWYAYRRWAVARGEGPVAGRDEDWDNGWLITVPTLARRRGTAPATIAAVHRGVPGTIDEPAGTSTGAHALTRSLPVALLPHAPYVPELAAQIAALTHSGDAVTAAAVGAETARRLGQGEPLAPAVREGFAAAARLSLPKLAIEPDELFHLGRSQPLDPVLLKQLSPGARAVDALAGALYVAAAAEPDDVGAALGFAASAGDGGDTAAVTGALLGAMHGVSCLPVGVLARLELVWVADTLARDLEQQVREQPSGSGYTAPADPSWWLRYPGG